MRFDTYSIRKRETKKKGIVYDIIFRIIDKDGRRKQKVLSGYKTKALARKAYNEFMSTYIAPPMKYDGKEVLTLTKAYESYCGYLKYERKESTLYTIIHTFKPHILPFFANKNMFELTSEDVRAWQTALYAKHKENGQQFSNERLKRIWGFFRAFVRWANNEYKTPNIFDGLKPPKRQTIKRHYVIWTKEQFEQFYNHVDNIKYKAIFKTLFYSGIRLGELQALEVNDFTNGKLHIYKTYTRKTLDNVPYKITDLKNYKEHFVPLPKHTQEIINEWLAYKQKNQIPNKYIFGNEHPISQTAISHAFKKYIAKAELPNIRIHDLRHSYASMLVSLGTNFSVIASLLGDTLDQVLKTYAHTTQTDIDKAINKL